MEDLRGESILFSILLEHRSLVSPTLDSFHKSSFKFRRTVEYVTKVLTRCNNWVQDFCFNWDILTPIIVDTGTTLDPNPLLLSLLFVPRPSGKVSRRNSSEITAIEGKD